jgi:hypothetical protein
MKWWKLFLIVALFTPVIGCEVHDHDDDDGAGLKAEVKVDD